MPIPSISVTIITLNEEQNIARAIQSVKWADEVLVVDSGSADRTIEIAQNLGARVLHQSWLGYGGQKNFAQKNASHDWVLNIDADEEVSPELSESLREALKALDENSPIKGFYFPRKTYYLGRWILHGGWYPNELVRMADRRFSFWTEPHVHEALEVKGEVVRIHSPLHHYTFRTIQDQILANLKYSKLGSEELVRKGRRSSLLLLLIKPLGKFLETYVWKRGFLDGLPGFIISINAAHSMFLKYAYLIEADLHHENSRH